MGLYACGEKVWVEAWDGELKQNRGLWRIHRTFDHVLIKDSADVRHFTVTITYLIVPHIDSWVTVRLIEFLGKEVFARSSRKLWLRYCDCRSPGKKNPADLHVSKSVDRYVHVSRLFVLSLPSKAAAAAP